MKKTNILKKGAIIAAFAGLGLASLATVSAATARETVSTKALNNTSEFVAHVDEKVKEELNEAVKNIKITAKDLANTTTLEARDLPKGYLNFEGLSDKFFFSAEYKADNRSQTLFIKIKLMDKKTDTQSDYAHITINGFKKETSEEVLFHEQNRGIKFHYPNASETAANNIDNDKFDSTGYDRDFYDVIVVHSEVLPWFDTTVAIQYYFYNTETEQKSSIFTQYVEGFAHKTEN